MDTTERMLNRGKLGMDAQLAPVLEEIDRLTRAREHVIVAIDGQCGSGKSTLAAALANAYAAPVLHMDDFFLRPHQRTPVRLARPGGNVDAERFLEEALIPLRAARAFAYRPFSCALQQLKAPVSMGVYPLVFVEGSYSLHPLLETHYDLKIVMTIDPTLQRERILARNGEEKLARFESMWIPLENRYLSETCAKERCDMRIHVDAQGHACVFKARTSA